MADIFFLTSNRVKFDHVKYLLRDTSVNLRPAIDYGRPYDEPQIEDRKTLLRVSMQDANRRLLKGLGAEYGNLSLIEPIGASSGGASSVLAERERLANLFQERLFIIEDTSVIIDALSTDGGEVPGVDVKYWMRGLTFFEIDRRLKERGNNRRVTVRSDVVLYLPKKSRVDGDEEFYKVFTGFSRGTIVDEEVVFQTNPMYPWLDHKTFNKWFVPDGAGKPISALPIDEALKYDFRKKAVEQLLLYLEDLHLARRIPSQHSSLPAQLPMFSIGKFVVCGPSCAGKTMLAEHLVIEHGFYHIEASDFMYKSFYEKHGFESGLSIHTFAAAALESDPEIVARQVVSHLEEIDVSGLVITGFRSPLEIGVLLNPGEGIKFLYVDADPCVRFHRSQLRARSDLASSFDDFLRRDEIQMSMGLMGIRNLPQVDLLLNEAGKSEYLRGFKARYLSGFKLESRVDLKKLVRARSKRPLSLEESVLVALLVEGLDKEVVDFLSTTQISQKINMYCAHNRRSSSGQLFVTNKNNVSRFFNQRVYPYFEILVEGKARRYALSPTGKSKAVATVRKLFS